MTKIYKEIAKRIPNEYEQIAFQLSNEIRQFGLNKYEYKDIRDQIYQEVESNFTQRVPASDHLKKKLKQLFDKKIKKGLKKTNKELFGSYIFIIFLILSTCFPIIYALSFTRSQASGLYSNGLNLYINFYNLFLTTCYCFLGVLVASLVQNISKIQRKKLILSTLLIGIIFALIFIILANSFPDFFLKLNFIIFEIIAIILTIFGYFLEDKIAYKMHEENISKRIQNKEKNSKSKN